MEILDSRYNSKTGYVRLSVDLRSNDELDLETYQKVIDYRVGSTITIKAQERDGYDFCYFYNPINKKILTKNKEYYFVITEDTFILIVYRKLSENEMNKKYDVYNFVAPLVKDENYNVKIDKNFVDFIDETQTEKDIPSSKAIMDLVKQLHEKVDDSWVIFTEVDKEKIDRTYSGIFELHNAIESVQNAVSDIYAGGGDKTNEKIEELQNNLEESINALDQDISTNENNTNIKIQSLRESLQHLHDLINLNFEGDTDTRNELLNMIDGLEASLKENTRKDQVSYSYLNNKIDNIPVLEEEEEDIKFKPTDSEPADW